MPATLVGRLTAKLVDHLNLWTAKLVDRLTAKLVNRLPAMIGRGEAARQEVFRGVPEEFQQGCSGVFRGVFQGVLALFRVSQTPEKENGNEKKGREMEGEVKERKVCKTKKSNGNVRKSMERK